MTDFQNLPQQNQTVLQIKLDGQIEACVLMARASNIGLSEALRLATTALLREIGAHSLDRAIAQQILTAALDATYPVPVEQGPQLIC